MNIKTSRMSLPLLLAFLSVFLAVPMLSSCACKEGAPPSFWCKVQERTVQCSKEIGVASGGDLVVEVLKALRSGPDWASILAKLVGTAGEEVYCILNGLPDVFAAKPQAGPAELNQRSKDLANAQAFLASRKVTIRAKAK